MFKISSASVVLEDENERYSCSNPHNPHYSNSERYILYNSYIFQDTSSKRFAQVHLKLISTRCIQKRIIVNIFSKACYGNCVGGSAQKPFHHSLLSELHNVPHILLKYRKILDMQVKQHFSKSTEHEQHWWFHTNLIIYNDIIVRILIIIVRFNDYSDSYVS